MNSMHFLVWLLPVIFMIHDFEEIIMVEAWGERYKAKIERVWPKRKPFGLGQFHTQATAVFSIAVYVEFILFSVIAFLSVLFDSYLIWMVVFLGLTIHYVIPHLIFPIIFKGYVPGQITGLIVILPSIYIAYYANSILGYSPLTMAISGLVGIVFMMLLVPALHHFMVNWHQKLDQYSRLASNLDSKQ